MKNVVAFSGGKDSCATVYLLHEMGIRDVIVLFSEVMFDNEISCELPGHLEFVYRVFERFQDWGYETHILRSDRTWLDYFYKVRVHGENAGKIVGFPMADRCNAKVLKTQPVARFLRNLEDEYISYVGYTSDELHRIGRLSECKRSILVERGLTQKDTLMLCMENDLLSPHYEICGRGGCFCCPNARIEQLVYLRTHHPKLWYKLLYLEEVAGDAGACGSIFDTRGGRSIWQLEEMLS